MFRKVIAVFLSLVMCFSCFAIAASAEEQTTEPTEEYYEPTDSVWSEDYDPWGGYAGNVLRAAELVPFSLICFVLAPFLMAIPPVGIVSLVFPIISVGNFFTTLVTGRSGF